MNTKNQDFSYNPINIGDLFFSHEKHINHDIFLCVPLRTKIVLSVQEKEIGSGIDRSGPPLKVVRVTFLSLEMNHEVTTPWLEYPMFFTYNKRESDPGFDFAGYSNDSPLLRAMIPTEGT